MKINIKNSVVLSILLLTTSVSFADVVSECKAVITSQFEDQSYTVESLELVSEDTANQILKATDMSADEIKDNSALVKEAKMIFNTTLGYFGGSGGNLVLVNGESCKEDNMIYVMTWSD